MRIRAATTQDEAALRSFLSNLCPRARYLRFFTGGADMSSAAHIAATVDGQHYGLIAHDEAGVIVGHAVSILLDDTRAEVAVEVADQLHGRGLGTMLIGRLAAAAERRGIISFVADVLPENREMLDVFHDGFAGRVRLRDGTDVVAFPTSAWRMAGGRFGTPEMGSIAEKHGRGQSPHAARVPRQETSGAIR